MKICSYNVNGLRAISNKGSLEKVFDIIKPDILCMQEVRCDGVALESIMHKIDLNISGVIYPNIHNIGYAGVASCWKAPYSYVPLKNIINEDLDNNLYFSGRIQVIPLKMDCENPIERILLINVYTLNSGGKDDLRKEWDKMFCSLVNILRRSFSIIICGDLNVVKDEEDHWKGRSNVIDQGPGLMQYEHEGFNNLLDLGLIDSYKYCYNTGNRKSWFSYRNKAYEKGHGWRLDYILVDERLKDKILDADIYEDIFGSDHRPIMLDINI